MSDDGYVLEIKPSARKRCGTAGQWVNREGTTRRFDSKALAREWARSCTGPRTAVWVQDAVPWDGRDVDGYLVGGTRGVPARHEEGDQAALSE